MTPGPDWSAIDVDGLLQRLGDGTVSAQQVLTHYGDRCAGLGVELRACIDVLRIDGCDGLAAVGPGPDAPLAGVPFAIKDNLSIDGTPWTCGSPARADHRATRDATVVARLRRAGAVPLARTNLDEFAFGGDSVSGIAGATRNPWPGTVTPGGSSGGSAVAVAAGLVPVALGSDTAGSVRNPASHCGVVGLRPRRGAIDGTGLAPLAPSLDTVGLLGRTVLDVAHLYTAVSDRWSDEPAGTRRRVLERLEVRPALRIGVLADAIDDCDGPVRATLHTAIEALSGAAQLRVEPVAAGWLDDALGATLAILVAEAAQVWRGCLEARRDAVDAAIRPLFDLGGLLPATTYLTALDVRAGIAERTDELLRTCDAIVLPTSGRDIAGVTPEGAADAVITKSVRYTAPWSLSDQAALSLPAGATAGGAPVGLQVVATTEQRALRVARAIEEVLDLPLRLPPLEEESTA